MQEVHFLLTCVAQKRLCLSFLTFLPSAFSKVMTERVVRVHYFFCPRREGLTRLNAPFHRTSGSLRWLQKWTGRRMKINHALLRNSYEEAEEEGKISREILLENSGREWDVPHAFCNPISNHNSDFSFTVSDLNHQLLLFPKDNLIPVPVPDRTKPYPIFYQEGCQ